MRHLAALVIASALVVSSSCAHEPPIVNDVVTCGGHTVQPADVTEAYTDLTTQNWPDLVQEGVRLGWDVVACVIDDLSTAHPELKSCADDFKRQHAVEIRNAQPVSLRSTGDPMPKTGSQPEKNFQSPSGEVMPAQAGMTGDEAPLTADPRKGADVDPLATGEAPEKASAVPRGQRTASGEVAAGRATDSASPAKLDAPRPPAGRAGSAGAAGFHYAGESVSHAAARCVTTCAGDPSVGSPGANCLCQRKLHGQLVWVASR